MTNGFLLETSEGALLGQAPSSLWIHQLEVFRAQVLVIYESLGPCLRREQTSVERGLDQKDQIQILCLAG